MRNGMTMARHLPTIAAAILLPGVAGAQDDLPRKLGECRRIGEVAVRVACYDHLAAAATPPRWAGRLSFTTEPFTIGHPTLLRFDSEGVIFVMYLKDAAGEVVQNLHHAGTGEGRYLIARSGTYTLQINGAEGWRIWLEEP